MKPNALLSLFVLLCFPVAHAQEFLDVENVDPGSKSKDPVAGKQFRIPVPDVSEIMVPVDETVPEVVSPVSNGALDPAIQRKEGRVPLDLSAFLHGFNEVSGVNAADALDPFYADRLQNYFGKRNVSKVQIRQDRLRYIRKFPDRSYRLLEEPKIISTDGDLYEVLTKVGYEVGNRSGTVNGKLKLIRDVHGFKIISIEEISSISRAEPIGIASFISAYVRSGESNDPSASVEFMSSSVKNYFGKRYPTRSAILADRKSYIRKWPVRSYDIIGEPEIKERGNGNYEVTMRLAYYVKNNTRRARGFVSSVVEITPAPAGFAIVSVREK